MENINLKSCPRCQKEYQKLDALSRRDNETMICSDCGNDEAYFDMYVAKISKKEKFASRVKEAMWLNVTAYNVYLEKINNGDN